jgi:hypothetical protein
MSATYGDSQKSNVTLAQGQNFPIEILALFDNPKEEREENLCSWRALLL